MPSSRSFAPEWRTYACIRIDNGSTPNTGLPISTTQTIMGAVWAIGLFEGVKGVNKKMMLRTWCGEFCPCLGGTLNGCLHNVPAMAQKFWPESLRLYFAFGNALANQSQVPADLNLADCHPGRLPSALNDHGQYGIWMVARELSPACTASSTLNQHPHLPQEQAVTFCWQLQP